ncbi:MAG: ATP-dependent Clp protease ATP-binding subunit ClpB, partial [Parvibaculaceae bacterium]
MDDLDVLKGMIMDLEKYTDRVRGFVQSAQGLATRSGHQRFLPEHLLKVLIDDEEGLAANLMRASRAKPGVVQDGVDAYLDAQP